MTGSESQKKCPFAHGCPFKDCKTPDEIASKLEELREDPVWKPFLESMSECPLWKRCPIH